MEHTPCPGSVKLLNVTRVEKNHDLKKKSDLFDLNRIFFFLSGI